MMRVASIKRAAIHAIMGVVVSGLFASTAFGREFCVAPNGSDRNSGALEQPFATIQHGAEQLRAGDTLHIRGGRYREQVDLSNLHGADGAPITLRNFQDETVIIDGTEPLAGLAEGAWMRRSGAVHSIRLKRDIWQLFLDGRLVEPARFPNAGLLDDSVWDMPSSMLKPSHVTTTNLSFPELAAAGRDFTGAVAVLATGHWLTYARPVLAHQQGSDTIHFASRLSGSRDPEVTVRRYPWFYLMGLPCLDCENEWWFDHASRTAWVWLPGGVDPVGAGQLTGRVRDYGVVIQHSRHLRLQGLEFFACAPFVNQSEHIRFERCRFRYPSENKFMLGQFEWFSPNRSGPGHAGNNMFLLHNGRHYAFVDCVVEFCNSPVGLLAEGIQIQNCLFHDIEWVVNSSGGSGSVWIGAGARAIHNTVHTCGNSEGLRPIGPGAEIAWNHLHRMGLMQIDGAAINCGMQSHRGLAVHHNWVHDCNREAIRFDYPDADGLHPDGQAATLAFNVMWNCQLPMIKGDRNLVHNNVSFGHHKHGEFGGGSLAGTRDLVILGFRKIHRNVLFNERTLACNNIARLGHFLNNDNLPCREDHNWNVPGAAVKVLRDPFNWDFRPKPNAEIVDAGRTLSPEDKPDPDTPLIPAAHLGKAPDIGAYEFGNQFYWIPGRQHAGASTPVPPDGSTTVRPDADLMFLPGYQAQKHIVYFGDSPGTMRKQAELKDTNICTPGRLEPGRTYFWRVDSVHGGRTIPGATWKFSVPTSVND